MLTITPINREELGDKQALFFNSNFMQSLFWAEVKEEYGFKPFFFKVEIEGEESFLSVLERPIIHGYSFAYIPHAPNLEILKKITLNDLSKKLKGYLPKNVLFIRYDLLLEWDNLDSNLIKGLKKSPVTVQVPDTTILDLTLSQDEILGNMHKKTRYNIKLAGKKGVEIREADISEIDNWYNMYKITAERDSIAIHSKEYYLSVYKKAKASPFSDIKLIFAEHEGELLSGIFVLVFGKMATYLYGASSNEKRNLMPSYLLQWEAIKLVKKMGAESYDFFGIPPTDDPKHPMHGLYRFKTGFSGNIIHRVGCYDYYLVWLAYIFSGAERLRNYYYKNIRKKFS